MKFIFKKNVQMFKKIGSTTNRGCCEGSHLSIKPSGYDCYIAIEHGRNSWFTYAKRWWFSSSLCKINVYQRVNPPRFHILSTIFPDPGWNPWPIDLASFRHPHAVTQTTGPRCVEGWGHVAKQAMWENFVPQWGELRSVGIYRTPISLWFMVQCGAPQWWNDGL